MNSQQPFATVRRITWVCLLLCGFVGAPAWAELPTDVQADILTEQIKTSVKAKQVDKALKEIKELERLLWKDGIPAPVKVLKARLFAAKQQYASAQYMLEHYFEKHGKKDKGYSKALALYLQVKPKAKAKLAADRKRQKRATRKILSSVTTTKPCKHCPTLVKIPAGKFQMGSTKEKDEQPVHGVTVSNAFWMGQTEVTFDQWNACVSAGGCSYRPKDLGWGQGKRPVINVSFDDAMAYVKWLNRTTKGGWALPTEAQWEYAARAGTTTPYSWKKGASQCDFANGSDEGSVGYGAPCNDGAEYTAEVGTYVPNAFGLFDMHGNVLEWTQDCWHASYKGAPRRAKQAWMAGQGGECKRRVLRGGSLIDNPGFLRSAFRYGDARGIRYGSIGFRVSRTLTP